MTPRPYPFATSVTMSDYAREAVESEGVRMTTVEVRP